LTDRAAPELPIGVRRIGHSVAVDPRAHPGADLQGVDLRGADLIGADLSRANLKGANLAGVWLQDTRLDEANLAAADLTGAHLCDLYLYRVNFEGACLTGAQLVGATFWECNLTDIDLGSGDEATSLHDRGALIDADMEEPPGPGSWRKDHLRGTWTPRVRTRDTSSYAMLEGYRTEKPRRRWWRRAP